MSPPRSRRTLPVLLLLLELLLQLSRPCSGQMKVLLVSEKDQQDAFTRFTAGIARAQDDNDGFTIDVENRMIDRDIDEVQLNETCDALGASSADFSLVVDLSWGGWMELAEKAEAAGFPYLRLDAANHQFVQAADDYLRDRGAIDAALVFSDEPQLDQSLYFLIGNSYIRVVVIDSTESGAMDRLASMRPAPSYYVGHGDAESLAKIYREAQSRQLVRRDARWTFVFQDWDWESKFVPKSELGDVQVTVMHMDGKDCCIVMNKSPGDQCDCSSVTSPGGPFVEEAARIVGETLIKLNKDGKQTEGSMDCYSSSSSSSPMSSDFESELRAQVRSTQYLYRDAAEVAGEGKGIQRGPLLTYPLELEVQARNSSYNMDMGTWTSSGGFSKSSSYEHQPIPRFFRIGTVPTTPWAFKKKDRAGKVVMDKDNKPELEGYCVEMVEELSKRMFFDYELILPTDDSEAYGKKENGTGKWTGIIGDLVNGEIDIAVAGMTMTSEREEVVDFVAPYFDQSGISIIIRKPVRPRSLFKFMEVLRVEVWVAILGALVVTALMLWFLDRFSPYSAQNNREAHPYPCRIFTLKESFWFALTSFTPQGGGEAPKSLSGRVLVAAYWLFVVLMLATFTANLAAFLTVERMQTTVQGLEELAQQSKINYTVVSESPYFEYFENMASAEEELYKVWKNLTLSSDADQSRYRVWDYPIKEQYTHIFKTIQASGMVEKAEVGFDRVLADHDGTFAFIHDASEVRYEYYNNCNFTEVGEPFAEQPYAVAVQQGSHLQEEISKVILELQKDRYFETLSSKYWNSTLRSLCPTLDDSEGITLTSLGGVFIATLVGLGIAMVVLAFEVYFHRKEQGNVVEDISAGGDKFSKKDKGPIRDGSNLFGTSTGGRNIIHVGSKEIHM